MFRILLEKDRFKFSVAHFTIFSRNKAERLHGHNYYVRASFGFRKLDEKIGMGPEMRALKNAIERLCLKLDERILVPLDSPYLVIQRKKGAVRVQMGRKAYEFPSEDVLLLPIKNMTCEALAEYFWKNLKTSLKKASGIKELSVEIRETTGQSASYSRDLTGS